MSEKIIESQLCLNSSNSQNSLSTLTNEEIKQSDVVSKGCTLYKRTKRKNQVWKHFTISNVSPNSKFRKISCRLPGCGKEFIYRGSSSTLRYHLKHYHNIIVNADSNQFTNQQQNLSRCLISSHKFKEFNSPEVIDRSSQLLFSKLKNTLQQVDSVSLAIVDWEIEGPFSYTEITCHWLSDDFQSHEILLDIIPIPNFFDKDEIFKSIEGVLSRWELDEKVNSITKQESWDRVYWAINELDTIHVNCLSCIENFMDYLLSPDLNMHMEVFCDVLSRELTVKEEDNIRKFSKQIDDSVKNSQQLVIYLITHEHEFLRKALEEYIVVLEHPIRQLIVTLSDNLETVSRGKWISRLLPNATIIKFFDNLNSYLKQFRISMQKLGENRCAFYDLLIGYLRLERLEIEEQNQLLINESLIDIFISDIECSFECRFEDIYYKIAFFNPLVKDELMNSIGEKIREEVKSEYLELRAEQKTSQNGVVDPELATSSNVPNYMRVYASLYDSNFRNLSSKHVEDNEFERYLLLRDNQSGCNDPIEWWNQHKGKLPIMAKLAQKYLTIPATSYSLSKPYSEHCNDLKILLNDLMDFNVVKKYKFLKHNMKYLS